MRVMSTSSSKSFARFHPSWSCLASQANLCWALRFCPDYLYEHVMLYLSTTTTTTTTTQREKDYLYEHVMLYLSAKKYLDLFACVIITIIIQEFSQSARGMYYEN